MTASLVRLLLLSFVVLLAPGLLAVPPSPSHAVGANICTIDPECRQACREEAARAARECIEAGHPFLDCWPRINEQLGSCIRGKCGVPKCEERCEIHAAKLRHRCLVAGGELHACREDAQRALRACLAAECKPCVCPDLYAPVCGADGRTYGNACEAGCAGVAVAHPGPCRCEPVLCELFCPFGFATDPDGCEICACKEPPSCRSDRDCPRGKVCELGGPGCDTPVCVPGCHEDAQCALGETCTRVVCVTCPCPGVCTGGPAECRSDADCGPGTVCEPRGPGCETPGACLPGCREDGQCAEGERCLQPACFTCPCPGLCAP